jgi:hypothetical protein
MPNIQTKLSGVMLDVDYDYDPAEGDGWNTPFMSEYLMINSIVYHDLELADLLNEYVLEKIEIDILEQLHQSKEDRYE